MALFQKSVITKYLRTQHKETVAMQWKLYAAHFLNPKVQEDIRGLKEEQYQGEFLEDLFVKILGYTKPASSTETKYNLTTEYKNVKDSKKADGAIIIEGQVKAVIELKGTNTTDLGKIEAQAFGYKNNQPECVYVITSNFEKLRFYIDNAIEYIEFNLFTLTEEEFQLLYLCLGYEHLLQGMGKRIKEESLSEEDVITKKLYKDYSLFKRELHQNLVELNPEFDPLILFKKSQKLLDRFLFLFFGEDRHLLPPNSVRLILTQWNQLRDLDEYTPLFERFKKYFGYLNTGHKGKQHDVFAYNGGLFKPDEVLDIVEIDDDILYRHTLKLSEYDFASEVDVNILGHIFENSLNELDEIKAQLEGQEIDKTKSKRKKDGVFYTPKYITKYIVENTVGKLCDEKKAALEIIEEDYFADKKRNKATKQTLLSKLENYREWLLQLTICDPACGSGAFLNQALDFLIKEHNYVDELQAKLFGDAMVLSDIENSILENNLFGVDLNEESVEIAKLSLWLRTAQPNRKLNDLSNNIKCGNSLIDDPAIAGDKAFNWEKEFPQVFGRDKTAIEIRVEKEVEKPNYLKLIKEKSIEAQNKAKQGIALSKEALEISRQLAEYVDKLDSVLEPETIYGIHKGGFDVVIGNPPYVRIQSLLKPEIDFYFNTYSFPTGKLDISILFFEKALKLISSKGIASFISSSQWIQTDYGRNIRDKFSQGHLFRLIDFGSLPVFEDADTYPSIFIFTQQKVNELQYQLVTNIDNFIALGILKWNLIDMSNLDINSWNFNSLNIISSLKSKNKEFLLLKDIANCNIGDLTGMDKAFVLSKKDVSINKIENEVFFGYAYRGEEVDSYIYVSPKSKIIYPYFQDQDGKTVLFDEESFSKNYPNAYDYLLTYKNELMERIDSRKKYAFEDNWFRHLRQGNINYYTPEKIIIKGIGTKLSAGLLEPNIIFNGANCPAIQMTNKSISIKYLLSILNSRLITFHLNSICPKKLGNYYRYNASNISDLPIIKILSENQQPFIEKADQMLSLNKEFKELSSKFQRTIQRKFEIDELPRKLQDWYLLSYSDFIKELAKKKVKLSLSQEAEWEDYFNQECKKALELKARIDATDKAIDKMVYALYGLTEEEIAIVEQN